MTSPRRVSILIVNWNARDPLGRCLRALVPRLTRSETTAAASETPFQIEAIVLDNASGDGSADMVAREFPQVRLLREPENHGFAGGVNRARRVATGDLLLLLNPDIELPQQSETPFQTSFQTPLQNGGTSAASAAGEAIETLARVFETDSEGRIGAVGGRLINPDGTPQHGFNVRRFPTIGSIAADLLLVDHLWPENPATRRYLARDVSDSQAADVDQPAAACLMVRASVFDALGGLDEQFYPAWFEDVDFCRRIRAAGFRIRYEPHATFVHHGGVAMRTLGVGAFSRIWYRNLERYVAKHHGAAARWLVKVLIAAGMLLRIAAALLRGDREAARGYWSVLAR
jgi:N-acetylglucosaminyl-diphospho-decaprenol L-rhamnosyltransferase